MRDHPLWVSNEFGVCVCVSDCLARQLTFHLAHNTPWVGEVPGAFPLRGEETWGSLSAVAVLWLCLHWSNYK